MSSSSASTTKWEKSVSNMAKIHLFSPFAVAGAGIIGGWSSVCQPYIEVATVLSDYYL